MPQVDESSPPWLQGSGTRRYIYIYRHIHLFYVGDLNAFAVGMNHTMFMARKGFSMLRVGSRRSMKKQFSTSTNSRFIKQWPVFHSPMQGSSHTTLHMKYTHRSNMLQSQHQLQQYMYASSSLESSSNIKGKKKKKKKKKNMDDAEKKFREGKIPAPDSTSLFRLTNPELFLDVNKKSTWRIVYAVWFFCLSALGYKYYEDLYLIDKKPADMAGPVLKDGKWK